MAKCKPWELYENQINHAMHAHTHYPVPKNPPIQKKSWDIVLSIPAEKKKKKIRRKKREKNQEENTKEKGGRDQEDKPR